MPLDPQSVPKIAPQSPEAADTETARSTSGIGAAMAKGAGWMILMRFGIRLIGIASTIILARLLVPEDFGLVALATTILAGLAVISEFSFDVVLIQNQAAGRSYYDTAWTLSVCRGLVVGLAVTALAVPLAVFLDDPRLEAIIYCLALATAVEGLQNVAVADFRKHLRFHKDFAFMVITKIGTFLVTIPLAVALKNYWALVIGIIAGAVIKVLLSYYMHRYRPKISLRKWREIMHFSKWLLLHNVLDFLSRRSSTFVIGKIAGMQSLGLYTMAYEISNLATSELAMPIRRAILPGYSKLAENLEDFRRNFIDTLALILLVAVPVATGIMLVADPLVRVALGQKWVGSIPIIEVLAIFGLIHACSANAAPVYLALKRGSIIASVSAVEVVVLLPLLIWGTKEAGAYGAAWALVVAGMVVFVVNTSVVVKLLGLRLDELLGSVWRTVAALAVMAVVVRGLERFGAEPQHVVDHAVLLAVSVMVGATAYVATILVLWRLSGAPRGPESHCIKALRDTYVRVRSRYSGA